MATTKLFSILIFIFLSVNSYAQHQKYWIVFKDKKDFSKKEFPSPSLSPLSLEKKMKRNIPVDERDYPVSSTYIKKLEENGCNIISVSRWFNAVSITIRDEQEIEKIKKLHFVKQVTPVKLYHREKTDEKQIEISKFGFTENLSDIKCNDGSRSIFDYGPSLNQIEMLSGTFLHNQGYTGAGIVIAVLDAGFKDVNTLNAFDSLRNDNRILGTWDFVTGNDSVYEDNGHGTMVLSCMAANLPGQLIGTAPHASYWLLRTEDADSEYIQEEDFWVMGAEFADSVGADIINSSLGYTTFDNPAHNHTYADLNGNTTIITKGADIAASKGILVINSAGNSGSSSWLYIGAPADGDSVLAIGAVDANSQRATFSSVGPSADGRVKPNVMAQGQFTVVSSLSGGIQLANGTSFSAPVLSGLAACLWQSKQNAHNMDIFKSIEKSAHQYNNPDSLMGYGIPNFQLAYQFLYVQNPGDLSKDQVRNIYPNPFKNYPVIELFSRYEQPIEIEVFDMQGKNVFKQNIYFKANGFCKHRLQEMEALSSGQYFIKVNSNSLRDTFKVVKID
jgi:hypothetical protein